MRYVGTREGVEGGAVDTDDQGLGLLGTGRQTGVRGSGCGPVLLAWAWAAVVASGSATAATVAVASTVRAERDRGT
ncbi:hypothetical protein [Streptomyces sp. BE133]|uniref:hypothetical protein n=1 Tax=Streptomyces sp. BE133 TaxID=3002523 RepID=UPI002E785A63|nr:hypothetical protein [Streptomyces sp. BE133]MEE1807751.1 hypothetical protein [Streptomyces sp. BE133]